MGLVHMPEVKYYWRVDQYFHYEPIASRISQNRFRSRSRYLHFKDNSKAPARGQSMHDRHGKVRPIIEQIGSALASSYIPGRDIVVDEAMIPFKGRSSLKQYMPMKPVKRGLKVWCLAESKTSYVHKFEVYTGKNDMGHVPEEKALGAQVVLSLTSHLQGKKLSLILWYFFTSVHLFETLWERGIYACGTVLGFPAEVKAPAKGSQKRALQLVGLQNSLATCTYKLEQLIGFVCI